MSLAGTTTARLRTVATGPRELRWSGLRIIGVHALRSSWSWVPIYVDAHQMYGLGSRDHRDSHMPDLAVAVHVLRSVQELLDMDEDGRPRHQNFIPQSTRVQGWKLEEQVRTFEQMSEQEVASFLFVVYSNQAQRQTVVEKRGIPSWAAWTEVEPTLCWASLFFRQRGSSRP